MKMMLCGNKLEYVIKGGYKEGFNSTTNLLPEATAKSDKWLVPSIITSRVHEDNFVPIVPHQDRAKRMWQALSSSHWNNTAGGQYMQLQSMMTTKADSDNNVLKFIGTMDVIC